MVDYDTILSDHFQVMDLSTTSRASALGLPPLHTTLISVGPTTPVHKEIGDELLDRHRTRHRKTGEVPYPLNYNSANVNL